MLRVLAKPNTSPKDCSLMPSSWIYPCLMAVGLNWLSGLRALTPQHLFLSARAELDNKLKAFELGALDYLTKPFELAELAMRVKLLAVKKRGLSQQTFVLDTLTVNLTLRTVHRGERLITLSAQQWQLLTHLIEHSPAAVSKQHIIDQIWPDQDSSNDMYKMLLARLRRNIDSEGDKPLIQTIRGVGVALRE